MTLVFPVISTHEGIIKPEYRDYYNQTLSPSDVETIIQLIVTGDYNSAITKGAVRKIIFHDQPSIRRLFNALAASGHVQLFEYFYKKVSYDDRIIGLLGINQPITCPEMRVCLTRLITDYIVGGDYIDEIQTFIASRCFN